MREMSLTENAALPREAGSVPSALSSLIRRSLIFTLLPFTKAIFA
jgi:hypothetical protein